MLCRILIARFKIAGHNVLLTKNDNNKPTFSHFAIFGSKTWCSWHCGYNVLSRRPWEMGPALYKKHRHHEGNSQLRMENKLRSKLLVLLVLNQLKLSVPKEQRWSSNCPRRFILSLSIGLQPPRFHQKLRWLIFRQDGFGFFGKRGQQNCRCVAYLPFCLSKQNCTCIYTH